MSYRLGGDGILTFPLYVRVTHEASYVIVCQSPLHFAAERANEDICVVPFGLEFLIPLSMYK